MPLSMLIVGTMDEDQIKVGSYVEVCLEKAARVSGTVVSFASAKGGNPCAVVFLDEEFHGYHEDPKTRMKLGFVTHIVADLGSLVGPCKRLNRR